MLAAITLGFWNYRSGSAPSSGKSLNCPKSWLMSADFVGEMISGGIVNRVQRAYGDAHRQALWEEFRKEMSGSDLSNWMYQGDKSRDRPADLGYYIGYRICDSFYRRATDKREAVRRILNMTDASEFLKESGYSG